MDGVRAEDELLGDLRVGESLRDKADHFHLTCRQVVRIGKMRSCWCGQRRFLKRLRYVLNLSCGNGLLRGHGASLCPRAGKGCFTRPRARGTDGMFVGREVAGRDRCTHALAQLPGSTPESCRP